MVSCGDHRASHLRWIVTRARSALARALRRQIQQIHDEKRIEGLRSARARRARKDRAYSRRHRNHRPNAISGLRRGVSCRRISARSQHCLEAQSITNGRRQCASVTLDACFADRPKSWQRIICSHGKSTKRTGSICKTASRSAQRATRIFTHPAADMAKTDFSRDAVIILSYLRTGASLEDSFTAMAYTDDQRAAFSEQYATEIAQAQAQCRILCLHNIFTEGGKS